MAPPIPRFKRGDNAYAPRRTMSCGAHPLAHVVYGDWQTRLVRVVGVVITDTPVGTWQVKYEIEWRGDMEFYDMVDQYELHPTEMACQKEAHRRNTCLPDKDSPVPISAGRAGQTEECSEAQPLIPPDPVESFKRCVRAVENYGNTPQEGGD